MILRGWQLKPGLPRGGRIRFIKNHEAKNLGISGTKEVAEIDMWLRIAKNKNLRITGEPENWTRFNRYLKPLMNTVTPTTDRIMNIADKIRPYDIVADHHAELDQQGHILRDLQDISSETLVVAKETRQVVLQVHCLLSVVAQTGAAAILDQENDEGFKAYSRLHQMYRQNKRSDKHRCFLAPCFLTHRINWISQISRCSLAPWFLTNQMCRISRGFWLHGF